MLAFAQAVEINVSLDGGTVEENIPSFPLDETESLVSQLLNRTLRHSKTLLARKTLVNLQSANRALQAN